MAIKINPLERRWMKLFGARLAAAMKNRGISQAELAKVSCLSQGTICKYLAGELSPKAYHVKNLANCFGVCVEDLL